MTAVRATRAVGSRGAALCALVPLLLGLLPLLLDSNQHYSMATAALIWGLWSVSLNIVWGMAGQLSLGQLALGAVAGYSFTVTWVESGSLLKAVLLASCLVLAASLVMSIAALRLRELYFTVVTLAFALAVTAVVSNSDRTGRTAGLPVPRYQLPDVAMGPVDWVVRTPDGFYMLVLVMFVLCNLGAVALSKTRSGQAMVAVRDEELVARSVGISPFATKTLAFVLSGLVAGIAGVLQSLSFQLVVPELFSLDQIIIGIMLLVIAGTGHPAAPTVAACTYLVIFELAPIDGPLRAGFLGVLVMGCVLTMPGGIAGSVPALRPRARSLSQRLGRSPV